MEKGNSIPCGGITNAKREPASHELMCTIDRVAVMAEKVAATVADNLHSVCLPERPSPTCDKEAPEREYPPLLNDMRNRIYSIERALLFISDVMDRCEV